ncbi:hypothetical protein C8T65DRAFT_630669 [Cerioporus squamosus]|nr:hypothetical protein C8T65DRAFT_630669 [Cerioporus squamosus]
MGTYKAGCRAVMIAVSIPPLSLGGVPCAKGMILQTVDVTKNAACGSSTCNPFCSCGCKPGECKC